MANIKHLLDKIRTAIYGKEVRGSLADGLQAVNNESEDAKEISVNVEQRQDAVEEQFDDVLSEWSDDREVDNAETIAARTNRVTGENHKTLGNRLDGENKKVTQQLAETADKVFYQTVMNHKGPKTIVTIIDDDARKELYEVLFPLIKELGIPITSAVVTNRVGTTGFTISMDEYRELRDSGYVEFISHGANHLHLADLPLDEVRYEVASSKEWLIRNGGNPDYFVYPFNSKNNDVIKIVREYYKGAFATYNRLAGSPLDTFEISRLNFDRDMDFLKGKVDEGVADADKWIIVNTHSHNEHATPERIKEFVNYCKGKGLDFVTVQEGMQHFANLIETPRGTVDANGIGTGIFTRTGLQYSNGSETSININTPLSSFNQNMTTTMHFTRAVAESRGFPEPGIYTVDRRTADFSRSFFYPYKKYGFYMRAWDATDNKWEPFRYIDLDDSLTENEITVDTKPQDMPESRIGTKFDTKITGSNREGFPGERTGILETDLRGGIGLYMQTFYGHSVSTFYRRTFINSTQKWSDWRLFGAG